MDKKRKIITIIAVWLLVCAAIVALVNLFDPHLSAWWRPFLEGFVGGGLLAWSFSFYKNNKK
jgi:hypothetical protein